MTGQVRHGPTALCGTGRRIRRIRFLSLPMPLTMRRGSNWLRLLQLPTLCFKFTLQDRQIDMVDLVSDAQKNQTSTTAASSSGKITFSLKHRLSRVGMQAKVDKDLTGNGLTKVFITGIKFTQAGSTLYKTANL